MFPLFNTLLYPLYPALGLYTLHRRFVQKKSAASFAGQWGVVTSAMRAFGRSKNPKIWLHAVSVGETVAALAIARALKQEIPELQIALSSTTDSGHEIAATYAQKGEVELAFFFPIDLPLNQTRVLNALRPGAILFVETELWPNLLHLARKRGIPTFLVNGRVSDNLLRTAPRLGPLWRWMSGNMTRFLMRGEEDATRLRQLKVPDDKIVVTGDIKLEIPPVDSQEMRQDWRQRLGLGDEPLLIAGSTHPGEEMSVVKAARQIEGLRVSLAPRHIDRAAELKKELEDAGLKVILRSENKQWKTDEVFLLDSVGELADFYSAADVAFVGGSLIPRGGHNMLEPVLRGAPVLFGPHIMNFRAAADMVVNNGLGTRLESEAELQSALQFWLDPKSRADFPARVETALAPHRGSAVRMARCVHDALR